MFVLCARARCSCCARGHGVRVVREGTVFVLCARAQSSCCARGHSVGYCAVMSAFCMLLSQDGTIALVKEMLKLAPNICC